VVHVGIVRWMPSYRGLRVRGLVALECLDMVLVGRGRNVFYMDVRDCVCVSEIMKVSQVAKVVLTQE
jgi:hypothetical protein